jgi:hypothetical protein
MGRRAAALETEIDCFYKRGRGDTSIFQENLLYTVLTYEKL